MVNSGKKVFDFNKDYILEDEVARLTPLILSDYESLLPFSLNEPEIWEYSLISGAGQEALKNYIKSAVNTRKENKEYSFLVFDKRTGSVAGSTRFYDIQLGAKTLLLGYTWYGKDFRGTGLNANCKYLLLDFAFGTMEMERVEFRADTNNKRSIAAMKSIGCVEEGVLRSNGYRPDGSRRDSIILSILRDEWFEGIQSRLSEKIKSGH